MDDIQNLPSSIIPQTLGDESGEMQTFYLFINGWAVTRTRRTPIMKSFWISQSVSKSMCNRKPTTAFKLGQDDDNLPEIEQRKSEKFNSTHACKWNFDFNNKAYLCSGGTESTVFNSPLVETTL